MIEWGADSFREWWAAHQGYRRTRSYGVLFSLANFWWQRLALERRAELLRQVGADPAQAASAWRALELGEDARQRAEKRAELREALERLDEPPLGAIVVRGRVWWDTRGKCYAVELPGPRGVVGSIQGDKSARGPPRAGENSRAADNSPAAVPSLARAAG